MTALVTILTSLFVAGAALAMGLAAARAKITTGSRADGPLRRGPLAAGRAWHRPCFVGTSNRRGA
jgi:hypothetical protein